MDYSFLILLGIVIGTGLLVWRFWDVVRPTRGVGLVMLLGILLCFVTTQGKELLVAAADEPTSVWWLVAAVIYWAMQSWHWARTALSTEFGVNRKTWPWKVLWLPRFYGLLVHLIAVILILFAIKRIGLHTYMLQALGVLVIWAVVFIVLLFTRIALLEWCLDSSAPRPRTRALLTSHQNAGRRTTATYVSFLAGFLSVSLSSCALMLWL